MIDVSFQRGKDGYVAEFDAPGSILMQIQGEKGGRLSMYQYIQGMPPAKIDTREFDNSFIQVNLIAGLKVRLESDVKVVACKYIQMPQANAGGGTCECEPYTLPTATASVLGGVKLGFTQTAKKYPVQLDGGGKAYVEVQWTDENTVYEKATDSNLGLIKIGFPQAAKKYPVQLDGDGKAYVEVQWTDTNTVYEKATDKNLGLIKIGFPQTAKKYPVVLDSDGKAYVEVNWTDTNTTYNAATKENLGLVKQLAFVANATGADDAHTKLNQILEDMKLKGVMASS